MNGDQDTAFKTKLFYRFFLVSFFGFLLTDAVAALLFFTTSKFLVSKLSVSYKKKNVFRCLGHMLLISQTIFKQDAKDTFDLPL